MNYANGDRYKIFIYFQLVLNANLNKERQMVLESLNLKKK